MATNRKYEIVNAYNWNGKIIKQIRALRSFGNVKKGQIGGWIESEDNLSHDGNCWIDYDCVVCGDTKVTGDIVVRNYLQFLYTVDQETLTIKPLRKNGWGINYSGFDKKVVNIMLKLVVNSILLQIGRMIIFAPGSLNDIIYRRKLKKIF